MPKLAVYVGSNVRVYRKKRGLSQEQLGERVQQPQSYIGGIERGEKNISLDTLEKFCLALGIKPGDLLEAPFPVEQNEKDKLIESISISLQKRSTNEIRALSKLIGNLIKMLDSDLR
ncbi:helix-turn-helix transcriptional regulator [Paenibacillus sp. FSL M7-0896]|uniref:helix-turn-helix domain-containing protein n=1 Tax=Paenibacillus sp. FSL M7-0896 TaxID=2921610 RepID=UPI0030D97574